MLLGLSDLKDGCDPREGCARKGTGGGRLGISSNYEHLTPNAMNCNDRAQSVKGNYGFLLANTPLFFFEVLLPCYFQLRIPHTIHTTHHNLTAQPNRVANTKP